MNRKIQVKNKINTKSSKVLEAILEELRLLRNQIMFLFPQDDLKDYTNPDRIKRSYQKAVKKYPPVSL